MSIKLEKREIMFALIGTIIILVWFLQIRHIIAPYLQTLHPFIAMLIYNFGLFIGLYLLAAPLDGKSVQWKTAIIIFVVFLGVDLLYAPYLVNDNGTIEKGFDYWYVATDSGFGSLYAEFLPANMIWTATYIFTTVVLVFILPVVILAPRQVAKLFGHG